MDPEKLLGGYVTGTLTEAERQILFEAALQDQALFNALADEQALKELLDDPDSRRRLIERLEQAECLDQTGVPAPRPEGGRALDPGWLRPPAAQEAGGTEARAERLYATCELPPPPKRPAARWALAGSLVVVTLAVLISIQLYEEAEPPSLSVPPPPSAPAPSPAGPAAPAPLPAGPAAPAPATSASPERDLYEARARSEVERRMSAAAPRPGPSARELFQAQVADPPLGVHYTLVKETGGGGEAEVSPATVFSTGEVLRLSIEVTRACYLYVLKRSSQGSWALLFPGPGAVPGSSGRAAYVKERTRYVVPPLGSLLEGETRGLAQVFIIVARDPQPDLADPSDPARVSDLVKRIRTEVAGGRVVHEQGAYVVEQGPAPAPRILAEVMVSHR